MAKCLLSPEEEFANSPFGVHLRRGLRRRYKKGPRVAFFVPRHTSENRRAYDLVIAHLIFLCRQKGRKPMLNVALVVPALSGQPMPPYRCWNWLIDSFEDANKTLIAGDEGLRSSLAFARGRLFAMYADYEALFLKTQMSKDAAEQQRLFAKEKAENGGSIDFFNSNTWQRLRFEVLAEADGCCTLCGRSYREHGIALEVDHIKPRSRFPNLALDKDNLQVMCFDCNRGKGNRDTTDWRGGAENDNPEAEAA